MTMLTQTRDPFTPASYSSGRRELAEAGTANAHMAAIKRFCVCALAALVGGSALAGVIALRVAIYFWRFHY
jgi:hypothetical protein